MPTTMPFHEAYARFGLAERLGGAADSFDAWGGEADAVVEVHAGDHTVEGPLRPYERSGNRCGLVVGGTLAIRGSLLDESSDDNTFFLVVEGDLVVEDLIVGGLCAVVGGSVRATGDAVFWDGHGQFEVEGALDARRVVILGGMPSVAGGIRGPVLNLGGWGTLPFPSTRPAPRDVLTPEAARAMLDAEGRITSPYGGDPDFTVAEAYFEGRRIFKDA